MLANRQGWTVQMKYLLDFILHQTREELESIVIVPTRYHQVFWFCPSFFCSELESLSHLLYVLHVLGIDGLVEVLADSEPEQPLREEREHGPRSLRKGGSRNRAWLLGERIVYRLYK